MKQYLRNWDVDGMLELERGRVFMPAFPLRTAVSKVQGRFVNDSLLLRNILGNRRLLRLRVAISAAAVHEQNAHGAYQ